MKYTLPSGNVSIVGEPNGETEVTLHSKNNTKHLCEAMRELLKRPDAVRLDEIHHVFSDHVGHRLRQIRGEEEEYSREELLAAIAATRRELYKFQSTYLGPLIKELRR